MALYHALEVCKDLGMEKTEALSRSCCFVVHMWLEVLLSTELYSLTKEYGRVLLNETLAAIWAMEFL